MPKSLTFEKAADHFLRMQTAPYSDHVGAEKILRGYIQRAIKDQVNYEYAWRQRNKTPERPEQILRDYEKAEADILPHHAEIMKAVNNFPVEHLKKTIPIAIFQGNEDRDIGGSHMKLPKKGLTVAGAMVGEDEYKNHNFTSEESMAHELAHGRDTSTDIIDNTDIARAYFTRRLKRGDRVNAYYDSPHEIFARQMQEAQKKGKLSQTNYDDVANIMTNEIENREKRLFYGGAKKK